MVNGKWFITISAALRLNYTIKIDNNTMQITAATQDSTE